MLGKLTGEDEADTRNAVLEVAHRIFEQIRAKDIRGLDLAGGDGGLLVVGSKLGGLGGDALENICWSC